MKIQVPNCRRFTGYSPCEPDKKCWECKGEYPFGTRILIINLDAMGDVMMTTAQLKSIRKKYPVNHITWLTLANAAKILENNPYIDEVVTWNDESRLILSEMHFDVAMNADKNRNSSAFMMKVKAHQKLGFGLNGNGAIIPLNEGAEHNYRIGLDDEYKFRINEKTGQEILAETFDLEYERHEYEFHLSDEEKAFCEEYRKKYRITDDDIVIGFNTGCSEKWPQKKMTLEQHIQLIDRIHKDIPGAKILLLGGKQDTERNQQIEKQTRCKVINTPTTMGLRKGFCFIDLADIVVTGDTFGMHAAIALKKYVIVWFGMSCAQEIDIYDRGAKIISNVHCSPCWDETCSNFICIQFLNLKEIYNYIHDFYHKLKNGELQRVSN